MTPLQDHLPSNLPSPESATFKPAIISPLKQTPTQPATATPKCGQVEQKNFHKTVETPCIQQPVIPTVGLRRSTREMKETQKISIKMKGKTYY